jgi:hypothetical protein
VRSASEIHFRIAQHISNLWMLALPPKLGATRVADVPMPIHDDPGILPLADQILAHRFRLLGFEIETGPNIEWRRDYVHNRVTGAAYFHFVPYLDFARAGDHKNVWELNRHQHLITLAQAWRLSRDRRYLTEIEAQLSTWLEQNPFLRGMNWASALEVAFRALSWLWVDHLVGPELTVRRAMHESLYQHAAYLEHNLSTYFSPNTHLLGEGVALHALGLKFPDTHWRALGERIVAEELARQVQDDGSHFEQSTYYHVYALHFFELYYELAGQPAAFREKIGKMEHYLSAVTDPSGQLPLLGDDDGGHLFPWSRSTTSQPGAEFFPNVGILAITRGDLHILIDAGPFGRGSAGHSHSDTLSLVVYRGGEEVLIDPGTYTYVADAQQRDAFRGSAFHNTLRIGGRDQADPVHPFIWRNKPEVRVHEHSIGDGRIYLDAECRYRGFVHRRRFLLIGAEALLILDEVEGIGKHRIEQFWHLGSGAANVKMLFAGLGAPKQEEGWRSRVLGAKEPAPVIALRAATKLPLLCATAFLFNPTFPLAPENLVGQVIAFCDLPAGFSPRSFDTPDAD